MTGRAPSAAPAGGEKDPVDGRSAAVAVLISVLRDGRSLGTALDAQRAGLRDPRERALAQELCYGVLRWQPRLEAILGELLRRPLRSRDDDLRALLLLGLYQLIHMRTPAHAAVAESAGLARALGKPWAVGVVNGVLRTFQRRSAALLAAADRDPAHRLAHPRWLLQEVRAAWPAEWESILGQNNRRPPMSLRVNARLGGREEYLGRLAAAGIEAAPAPHTTHGLTLAAPVDVERLPGFGAGAVSVQDASAQLAAELLDLHAGRRVLDACAAPGGKTAHLLEREPRLARLLAVDRDEVRLRKLRRGLERLHLQEPAEKGAGRSAVQIICADASEPKTWWDHEPFDRILLDAPCSGTGVIRRHPDIKLHRQPQDVRALCAAQGRLLDALWPLLARGGLLLYATCSILPRENALQVASFLERHADAHSPPVAAGWGRPAAPGRQILTGEDGMDGFYYAVLARR